MSASLEDILGSALETSFNLPPPPAKESSQPKPDPASALQSSGEQASAVSSAPIPGMDEWKDTLEGYTKEWQAESSVARAKAEATRKKFEDALAAEEKKKSDKIKEEKRVKAAQEKAKKDKERLERELDPTTVLKRKDKGGEEAKDAAAVLDRAQKVKEAWEMVKPSSSSEPAPAPPASAAGIAPTEGVKSKDSPVVDVDARGVTDADIVAGQATTSGSTKQPVKPRAYDPTTSKDPIPPAFQDEPASTSRLVNATESQTSATSQAWEEVSKPSSTSGSGSEDIVEIPSASASKAKSQPQPETEKANQPPSQPPSLTLSLFTLPSQLSVSRVLAVVGINLVLPFINGVMLGFGEIFAREVLRVGKAVWRGERSLFGGGRGVAGVGLSSGGF